MWKDIRTMIRRTPLPWIAIPVELAILCAVLAVFPYGTVQEYTRWRSGLPKPERSLFCKATRWLPFPLVTVPLAALCTLITIPCAGYRCCFGSEESAIATTDYSHTTGHVQRSGPSIVICKGYTVTFKPSDGRQQTVVVVTTDGDNLKLRRASNDSAVNVTGPKNDTHNYQVIEGTARLRVSWQSPNGHKQQVSVDVHADGKVNVASTSVQQCGTTGEKLIFDGCRVRVGDIPLKIALQQDYWKRPTTPQNTATQSSHFCASPPSRLVEVFTFDADDNLVMLKSMRV